MTSIWKAGSIIFAYDPVLSGEFIDYYTAEHNLILYRIRVDRTEPCIPPYYELFRYHRVDGRLFNERLFATSKVEKLRDWIEGNL